MHAARSRPPAGTSGHWVHLPEVNGPPYELAHLHDAHRARVEGCDKLWPKLFQWGWSESGAAGSSHRPRLLEGDELCRRMRGLNLLFIGDSLSLQLYDSWRARLRQTRYAAGRDTAERTCKGDAGAGELPCEGFAPVLCQGSGPILCNGGAPPPQDPGRGSLYSACDNGATFFMAQAYRWVLDASDFTSSDRRGDACAARVRADPLSFGLVVVSQSHVASMVRNAAWTPHGPPRRSDGRRGARGVAVVLNQFAHVHAFVAKVMECYARAGIGSTPEAPGTATPPEDYHLAARDVLRFWSADQGRWAETLRQVRVNLSSAGPTGDSEAPSAAPSESEAREALDVRIFYRTSPASCDAFCTPPHGAPRSPVNASSLVSATMNSAAAFSHQLVYALNDVSRAAFRAHGHGIIDVESMLGARVDAYPGTHNGEGDKLHFCQPGPGDWAMDVVVRRISAEWRGA